jgi:glycosyltransferase involved in cell wall biosynthesis
LRNELERVYMLGYVADEYLPGLYAGATLFVLPSFDEGFGLPALEAMACGVPVIVSNRGALCEIVGDGGCIFDLAKHDSLSNAIREGLTNEYLRASLKEKGWERSKAFSWQTTADLIWKTLNEI